MHESIAKLKSKEKGKVGGEEIFKGVCISDDKIKLVLIFLGVTSIVVTQEIA